MVGQYHCYGAVLAVAGRDAWASQTGVLFRMAQSLYGCSFFPGLCGGYHCHYGVGTAGSSTHPSADVIGFSKMLSFGSLCYFMYGWLLS